MRRLDGENLLEKRNFAMARRARYLHNNPLKITAASRVCVNCNKEILKNLANRCTRFLNRVAERRRTHCIICDVPDNLRDITFGAKVKLYRDTEIFIDNDARCCAEHLLGNGMIHFAFYGKYFNQSKAFRIVDEGVQHHT